MAVSASMTGRHRSGRHRPCPQWAVLERFKASQRSDVKAFRRVALPHSALGGHKDRCVVALTRRDLLQLLPNGELFLMESQATRAPKANGSTPVELPIKLDLQH